MASKFTREFPGYSHLHKFGRTPDVDSTDTNEEVWDATGAYPFPADNAETTVVSSSTADDAGSTGATEIVVVGIVKSGSTYTEVQETVTMDGQSVVTLSNSFYRVYRAWVSAAGTGLVNAGNIDVKHGATVIARISAGLGQTLMAVYTVPSVLANGTPILYAELIDGKVNVGAVSGAFAQIAWQTKVPGGAWRTQRVALPSEGGHFSYPQWSSSEFPPGTDIRTRILTCGVNNTIVTASFDLALKHDSLYD